MKRRKLLKEPYRILGVSPDADAAAIHAAFRCRARQFHPDLRPGSAGAARLHAEFVTLTSAWALVGRADRRAAWDTGQLRPDRPLVDRTYGELLRTARRLDSGDGNGRSEGSGCGDEGDALEWTQAAIALKPRCWQAYLAHATILAHRKDFDEAKNWICEARRRGPHVPAVHRTALLIGMQAPDLRSAWHGIIDNIELDKTLPAPVAWFDVLASSCRRILCTERIWRFVRLVVPFGRWHTIRRVAGTEMRREAGDDSAFVCCSICAVIENLLDCC